MTKPAKNITVYPLSMSQKMVSVMGLICFNKAAKYIPFYILTERQFDFEIMKKAFNEEIKRNDCMRICFFHKGITKYQYFMPEREFADIPCFNFKDKKEQDEVLGGMARKAPKDTFKVALFKRKDGKNGVFFMVDHLIMDAMAVSIFFTDLLKVYDAIENGKEMPKPLYPFEESLKRDLELEKDEAKQKKGIQAFTEHFTKYPEKCFTAIEGEKTLDAFRKKKKDPTLRCMNVVDPFHDKTDLASREIPAELMQDIGACCREQNIVAQHYVCSAMRIYLAFVNGINDIDIPEMCSRRALRNDKNTGGCRVHTYQIRSRFEDDTPFCDVVDNLAEEHMFVYRNASTDPMKILTLDITLAGHSAGYAYSGTIFTYMPNVKIEGDTWNIEKGGYNPGSYVYSMYMFFHESPKTGALVCDYEYRTRDVSVRDIDNCQDNMVRILKAAVERPTITVGELKKLIVIK